jgi:hypothetical protein
MVQTYYLITFTVHLLFANEIGSSVNFDDMDFSPLQVEDEFAEKCGAVYSKDGQRFILDQSGVQETSLNVCENCLSALNKGKLPAEAIANKLWTGDPPECLTCLTLVEKFLIAKVRNIEL